MTENMAPKRPHHRTVDRVAQMLEATARSEGGLTLTELASAAEAPLSSIQSLVNGLTAAGFLAEVDRRFQLGPAPYLLSSMANRPLVRSVGRAQLEALHRESGHAVLLAVLMSRSVYYIDVVGDLAKFHYLTDRMIPRPPLRSSAGRAIAATLERRDLWGLIQSLPDEDVGIVDAFLAEVDDIRDAQLAYGAGLTDSGLHGIATPVVEQGRTVAAVSIVGPARQLSDERPHLERLLREHRGRWAT
ncbi:IclR family transcriptional regulator [Actinomadura madurae]|uniref:IclR family transcriptional regulator n=1 Tax=Actinomadura madurae TaxID=1993 RepID=UPI000D89D731|nr:helix-turn-helix domain-containing protein [Actinomadura madurae]SPT51273.1 transcriptional repressor IclR [Actinomadura madurae]